MLIDKITIAFVPPSESYDDALDDMFVEAGYQIDDAEAFPTATRVGGISQLEQNTFTIEAFGWPGMMHCGGAL